MQALILAVGNALRRDDGAAHFVLSRLGSAPAVQTRALLQLTPELAEEIADFDVILFIDADASVPAVTLEPLDPSPAEAPSFTHVSRPAEIVALSRALYGFAGRAFLCRIPVDDLSAGEGLSHRATVYCQDALNQIGEWSAIVLKTS